MPVETQSKIMPQVQPPQPGNRPQSIQPTKTDATAAVRSAAAQEVNQPLSLSVCQFLADMGYKIFIDVDGKPQPLPEFVKTVCTKHIKEIDPKKRNDAAYLIGFALRKTQSPKLIAQLNTQLDEKTRNDWRMAAPQLKTIALSQLANSDPPKPSMPATNKAERPSANQAAKIVSGPVDYSEMTMAESCKINCTLTEFFSWCSENMLANGNLTRAKVGRANEEINTVGVA